MSRTDLLADLAAALQPHGMILRGGFALTAADAQVFAAFPEMQPAAAGQTLLLVGNAGPDLYRAFFAARGARPEGPHALDRWTRSVVEPVAARFGARAGFPFGGPPWLPFQTWAQRAEGLKPSPLGILIHPRFGLWHAYRAALIFDLAIDPPPAEAHAHPCATCTTRPCLTTCPVGAVAAEGYRVDSCAAHVRSPDGTECRSRGCLARRACPVAPELHYPEVALAFHMAAFLEGRAAADAVGR
jgi:hypothetical protein